MRPGLTQSARPGAASAVNLAVGFFDGVHRGHQRILARADAVLTFVNHPATVLAPDRAPALLMTPAARLAALAADGARAVTALDFTRALADEPPAAFADWLRAAYPRLDTLFCGPNWSFGAGGAGDADFLRARGLRVVTVPFARHDGQPVSSTRVRASVAAGDLPLAAALLGRDYAVTGEVVPGKGLGRTLGYPTINLRLPPGLVRPPLGVYAVATPLGRGLANYGRAPTLGDRAWAAPTLEVHLVDAAPGVTPPPALEVALRRFIRPERRFASLDALAAQIARDLAALSAFSQTSA